jgi:hypothetical protein
MIFTILILIFFGAVVFFHYIQGFFSAAISAILVVFAAVIAFSYHESLVPLLGGKFSDYSTPIFLLALFGLTYLIMRLAFDKIPGNLRLPLMLDKAGAVVMGLIAGVFATGIMAIAAAEMPFGPDIAGFTRFDAEAERPQKVETKGRAFYGKVWADLADDTPGEFEKEGESSAHGVPIIPVDNIVISTVSKLSGETGSLQNGKPLELVHPDFLTEAFGQRLGIEASAGHTAVNLPGGRMEAVKVLGVFSVDPKIAQADAENARKSPLKLPISPGGGKEFVAVRVLFTQQAADADTYIRFSPGSVRLMLHDTSASGIEGYKDYYPVGTMESTGRMFVNKIDDYLFCKQGNGADFVFSVPKKLVEKGVSDGSFIEVKRDARVDLSGMKIEPLTPNADIVVMRKDLVLHPELNGGQPLSATPSAAPSPSTPQPSTPAPAGSPPKTGGAPSGSGLNVVLVSASNAVPVQISLQPGKADETSPTVPGGGFAKLQAGKLKNINMEASSLELKSGTKMGEFAVPAGQAMVQVKITPGGSPNVAWAFATDPEQYELVDSAAKHYPPNGFVALFRGTTGERVVMRYIDSQSVSGIAMPTGADAPGEAYLLYLVPTNTKITEFDDHGQKAKAADVVAK